MKQKQVFKKKITTLEELNQRIKEVMVEHIGVEKEITKGELFKELFGSPDKYSEIQEWWLWDKVKKAMNWLRRTSNCFISSRQPVKGVWSYFVVKDYKDLDYYKNNLKNNIKRMYSMIDRGEKLVEKKAYKEFEEEMSELKSQ